jgi:lysozyme
MRQLNYGMLWGLCLLLLQACHRDHRMGHRAKGEIQAKQDSMATLVSSGKIDSVSATMEMDYPAEMSDVAMECRTQVAGIDISHWDGDINWTDLDNQGSIYFVYMKATEGETFVDPSFEINWAAIRRTSLRRGAYLFFDPWLEKEAQVMQARNFIETVKDTALGDLPPMIDVEDDPEVAVETFQTRLLTVVRLLQAHFSARPIIYTTAGLYRKYLTLHGSFGSYELWIADYAKRRPQLCDKKDMRIWQFTDRAKLRGVPSPVDMDIFYSTPEDLENLVMAR